MKKKFEVGDRLMVYGWVQMLDPPYEPRFGGKARIVRIDDAKNIFVRFLNCPEYTEHTYLVYPKQCRRLIKKPRRRFWVNIEDGTVYSIFPSKLAATDCAASIGVECIEVVEVRKK